MKKLLSALIILFIIFSLFTKVSAQNVAIGVRGGLSIPNLSAGGSAVNPLNSGYSSRQGPDFGVFADLKVSNFFSIEPMVQYSSQGGKKDGFQALPTPSDLAPEFPTNVPTYLYATFNSEAKLNYLMIPLLAKFGWDLGKKSTWRFYIDAGPFAGFLLSAHQVVTGTSFLYADQAKKEPVTPGAIPLTDNENIKDQLHTFDLGAEGNLGFAYKIGHGSVFIEGGGNYGFLNIQKGTANGKNNTGAATADIGYSFALGK